MNEKIFWNCHNTFKKIPQQNLGNQLLKVDKKISLVVGPDKTCLYLFVNQSSLVIFSLDLFCKQVELQQIVLFLNKLMNTEP